MEKAMRNIYTLLAVLALAAGFAFAQDVPAQQSQPDQSQQQMPQTQQPSQQTPPSQGQTAMSSQDLQTAMQSAFQKDPALSNVTASVADQKIELAGTVASKADQDKAHSIAETNAGGRQVVDKIKVSGGESTPPSTPPQ
jgi:osmotically-inducible protein OsmY